MDKQELSARLEASRKIVAEQREKMDKMADTITEQAMTNRELKEKVRLQQKDIYRLGDEAAKWRKEVETQKDKHKQVVDAATSFLLRTV